MNVFELFSGNEKYFSFFSLNRPGSLFRAQPSASISPFLSFLSSPRSPIPPAQFPLPGPARAPSPLCRRQVGPTCRDRLLPPVRGSDSSQSPATPRLAARRLGVHAKVAPPRPYLSDAAPPGNPIEPQPPPQFAQTLALNRRRHWSPARARFCRKSRRSAARSPPQAASGAPHCGENIHWSPSPLPLAPVHARSLAIALPSNLAVERALRHV